MEETGSSRVSHSFHNKTSWQGKLKLCGLLAAPRHFIFWDHIQESKINQDLLPPKNQV